MESGKKIALFSIIGAVVIAAAVTIGVFAGRGIERRANKKQLADVKNETVADENGGTVANGQYDDSNGTSEDAAADSNSDTEAEVDKSAADDTEVEGDEIAPDDADIQNDKFMVDDADAESDKVAVDDADTESDKVAVDDTNARNDESDVYGTGDNTDAAVESAPDENDKEPAVESVGGYAGGLHVEGTYLADSSNNPVILRGISSHGLGWFPEYINEAAIRQFKEEWGCNVIRLAMYTDEYNGYCSSGDEQKKNLKKIIDTGVKAASKNDMYVIIDWHILHDGNPNQNKGEALKFFGEMSEKYADNPHVIYEICNEPNGGVSWAQVKQYALEVIPVIRKNAPNAVVIVGSPTWSQDVDLAAQDPITEYDNIAYSLHFYAATHKQGLRDKASSAIKKGLCLLVTEYGVCDASGNGALDLKEADTWIKFLDKNNIGYIAWNLSNKAETSSMIKSSCSKKSGFTREDMSEGGIWFLNMLKNEAGGLGPDGSGKTDAGKEDGTRSDFAEENNADSEAGQSGSDINGQDDVGQQGNTAGNTEFEKCFSYGEDVILSVANYWDSGNSYGVQLNISVKNNTDTDLADWSAVIKIDKSVKAELKNCWNAIAVLDGRKLRLEPAEYNRIIPAGGTAGDIGLILEIEK